MASWLSKSRVYQKTDLYNLHQNLTFLATLRAALTTLATAGVQADAACGNLHTAFCTPLSVVIVRALQLGIFLYVCDGSCWAISVESTVDNLFI